MSGPDGAGNTVAPGPDSLEGGAGMNGSEKKCTSCGQTKPSASFGLIKNRWMQSWCTGCTKEHNRVATGVGGPQHSGHVRRCLKTQQRVQSESYPAANNRAQWTEGDLRIIQSSVSARDAARLTGRSFYAVKAKRRRMNAAVSGV